MMVRTSIILINQMRRMQEKEREKEARNSPQMNVKRRMTLIWKISLINWLLEMRNRSRNQLRRWISRKILAWERAISCHSHRTTKMFSMGLSICTFFWDFFILYMKEFWSLMNFQITLKVMLKLLFLALKKKKRLLRKDTKLSNKF